MPEVVPVVDVVEGHGGYWHQPPEPLDEVHHTWSPLHDVDPVDEVDVLEDELPQESLGPMQELVTLHQFIPEGHDVLGVVDDGGVYVGHGGI